MKIRWWTGFVVVAVGAGAWYAVLGPPAPTPPRIPAPLGGPQIAVDVNTMVGKQAPPFALQDADGVLHTVVPGRGRPLVVISHMGFF